MASSMTSYHDFSPGLVRMKYETIIWDFSGEVHHSDNSTCAVYLLLV